MKRKIALFIIFCMSLVTFHSCDYSMDMNSVRKEPKLIGIVYKVFEDFFLVDIDGTLTEVSRDVKLSDSPTSFMSADVIRIYYDGTIEEGDPPKINTVYAFNQVSPSKKDDFVGIGCVNVQYFAGDDEIKWAIENQDDLDDLYRWFCGLVLLKEEFPEGETPADKECNEIYHMELYDGSSNISFSYYIFDEDTVYLIYYEEWYRVEDPIMPFDMD